MRYPEVGEKMKFTLKNRPSPTFLMTQPYTSSVNIDTLMGKIREWEMFADGFIDTLMGKIREWEMFADGFEKELREYRKQLWKQYQLLSIPSVEGPKLRRVIDFIDKEILGE